MIRLIYKVLIELKNRDYLARVPRLFRRDYRIADVSKTEWLIVEKMGARDPNGIGKIAKKRGLTVDELERDLSFYTPENDVSKRLKLALARLVGGVSYDIHAHELKRAMRQNTYNIEVKTRVFNASRAFRGTDEKK